MSFEARRIHALNKVPVGWRCIPAGGFAARTGVRRGGYSPGTMNLQISRDGGATWTPPKQGASGRRASSGAV